MADRKARREIQKRKLRENLIEPGSRVELRERRSWLPFIAVLSVILLSAAALMYYRYSVGVSESSEIVWERDTSGSGAALTFRGYANFAGGIITYTKDGAEYTDGNGRSVWQKSYQMSNPVCCVNGAYAVIADKGSTRASIFSNVQNTGNIATVLPIAEVSVSERGVVYAVLNDDEADFITVYRKDGSEIDITVKSKVDGDGYPFSISASPDGSQLLTSYISIGEGQVKESVVFRNFGEVGQNEDARRVVGGFMDEFEGHIVTKVKFADDVYSHAFYDGGIVFFSTKVLNSPAIIKKVEIEEEMLSVADSGTHAAVITAPSAADGKRKLSIYDNSGNLTGSAEFELAYRGFEVNEKNVIIYSTDRILAYSLKGRLIADLSYDGKLSFVTGTGRLREFITAESGRLCRIKTR